MTAPSFHKETATVNGDIALSDSPVAASVFFNPRNLFEH
jgi:hypothetical protein